MDPSFSRANNQAERRGTLYWGENFLPLACVEVRPRPGSSPAWTAAFVKHCLMHVTFPSPMKGPSRIVLEDASSTCIDIGREQKAYLISGSLRDTELIQEDKEEESHLYFTTNDPASTKAWPCHCTGYALLYNEMDAANGNFPRHVLVDESTLVLVLPPLDDIGGSRKYQRTGEAALPLSNMDPQLQRSLLATHNPSTIAELRLRLQRSLQEPIWIATAPQWPRAKQRRFAPPSAASLEHPYNKNTPHSLFQEAALLVHSPEHGAGKTALVQLLAQQLHCNVHVLSPGPLWAQFGAHADLALSGILHSVVLQAALRNQSVCFILDQFDALLPNAPSVDPVGPGMVTYMQNLVTSLQDRRELPFPRNKLYNFCCANGIGLPVRLCLVAIRTGPDHDRTLHPNGLGLYRLPNLTSTTRYRAFRWAMEEEEGLTLSEALARKLPHLAAAAVWARGCLFLRVAQYIRSRPTKPETSTVSIEAFLEALNVVGRYMSAAGCQVEFLAAEKDTSFDIQVGGNEEAKASLQDALALDPSRRALMASLGLSPNTGLLLYGPPGTGKTLLAKAVAKALRSPRSSIGGAFLSLSTSDIVRAEVGVSEKLVAAAFQTTRANAPAVIFIDEFQALFTERGRSGSSNRLTSTLLQCMDDLKEWGDLSRRSHVTNKDHPEKEETRVLVLAATNTPWMIDRAFLRPGRFDRSVLVNLPNHAERVSILRIHTDRMRTGFSQSMFLEDMAHRTAGFSGADLAALCRAAAVLCLERESDQVEEQHFMEALKYGIQASSSESLVKRIAEWHP